MHFERLLVASNFSECQYLLMLRVWRLQTIEHEAICTFYVPSEQAAKMKIGKVICSEEISKKAMKYHCV